MDRLKNILKKSLILSFVFIFTFFFSTTKNYADDFYRNDIKVVVKKDGSADIESVMDYEQTKGSEYYIPIDNLSKSNIINFTVSEIVDGKEVVYKKLDNWDVKKSLREKENKCGIVKKSDGVELCFGVGEYKRKTFILRYTVTNFIKNLNDSDMLFWKFINDNLQAPPQVVNITISKQNASFDKENSKIWAFGSKGKINFIDGKIVFSSLERIKSNNYVTILSKIDKGYFTGGEKIYKNFDDFKTKAFKGSGYKKNRKKSSYFKVFSSPMFPTLITMVVMAIFSKNMIKKKFKGGYKAGDLKSEYYRTIPTKQWYKLSYVLECAGFSGSEAVIRAYFLNWIQQKLLIPITEEKGKFIFKKEVLSLKINENIDYKFVDETEEILFSMVEVAARDDRILQEDEFKSYLKSERNQREFKRLTNALDDLSVEFVRENNFVEKTDKGKWTYNYNEKGKEFTEKLIKYYNYLKDFTLLSEREIAEIKVWKELLIYASLFEVTKTVEKQLKKLSPEVIEDYDIDINSLHTAMIYSYVFSSNFINAYASSVERSSGGTGGFSSSSGGFGSFGGGSGGGSR